jgi:hypothetical protein
MFQSFNFKKRVCILKKVSEIRKSLKRLHARMYYNSTIIILQNEEELVIKRFSVALTPIMDALVNQCDFLN